jgi:hypothetical protein
VHPLAELLYFKSTNHKGKKMFPYERRKIHSVNLDAGETFFFARELEYVKSKSYDIEFPEMKAFKLIPISTEAGEGATAITYAQFEEMGLARVIESYADDLPRADIRGKEFTTQVKSIGASYGYSVQEIRSSIYVGRSLTQREANAARRANDQKVNRLAWFGDNVYKILGMLNNANIPSATVLNDGIGATTEWVNKTPDQILRDMNNLANSIPFVTKGVEMPNTLILPVAQYTLIASTPRSSVSDTTILEYFIQNNPFITVVDWVPELTGAGPVVGLFPTDVMIAYDRNPDKLTMEIPMPFTQYPPQERGLEFVVPCESRYGGIIVYYPLSLSIGFGI